MQAGNELLDLSLALVSRSFEHVTMVVSGEMRREQPDCRQRQRAVRKQFQQEWIPSPRACRLDATVGCMFGQMQHLRAVRKQ